MPIWLSISLIALVAGLGTGGTWYVMDQKVKKNDDKITTLQGQVDKLTKDAAKVTPTPTVIVTPTPTVAADATAKWKKYTYNKYAFSVMYPTSFVAKEEPQTNGDVLTKIFDKQYDGVGTEAPMIILWVADSEGQNVKTWWEKNNSAKISGGATTSLVKINTIDALKVLDPTCMGGSCVEYHVPKDGRIYSITGDLALRGGIPEKTIESVVNSITFNR